MSKQIRELRNLGPACESDLHAVGIYTLEDIESHGVEGTFLKFINWRRKRNQGKSCYNALYLYALYGAVHDLDWREIPQEKKDEFKALTESYARRTGKQG